VPYERGDLVSRIHEYGEVLELDHTADGTRVRARVHAGLGSELEQFAVVPTH
jgi:GTP-binding protein HflX